MRPLGKGANPDVRLGGLAEPFPFFGRLDAVIANAGIEILGPLETMPMADVERVMEVDLLGVWKTVRATLPRLTESRGYVLVVSSVSGATPGPFNAAYNAAKAGVISLTRTLALELAAYGVRVNAVCPGPVYTDFNRTVMSERCKSLNLTEAQMVDRIKNSIPLGRWGEAKDIAAAVAFLCSDESSWMTGEVLRVSGGLEGVAAAPPRRSA